MAWAEARLGWMPSSLGGGVASYGDGDCPGVCCGCRRCRTERGGIPGMLEVGGSRFRAQSANNFPAYLPSTFDESTQCTIVFFLLEECLEYGLVVPFP